MSFLDRWFKKKKTEQLSERSGGVKAEQKSETSASAKAAADKKTEESERAQKGIAASKASTAASGAYRIIVRPLVTEKAATMQSAHKKYSFIVTTAASKGQIKQAIKELYGIEPVMVNVVQVQGRRVRFGRHLGRRSDYKKAVVTLPAGKSITVHEGV